MYKTQKKQGLNLMKSLTTVAQQMDLYAQPVQLRINKNDKFTTPLGIVFSIGLMTVCGILGINNIYDVISKTNPSVVSSQDQQKETQEFILGPQNFTYIFSTTNLLIQNVFGLGIYYNITIQNCYRKKVSSNVTLSCETYLFEQCTDNHFQAQYQQEYFGNFNKSNMMCINYEQWMKKPLKLQGNPSSNNYWYLRPQMTRCKGNTCVTKEILISKLPAGVAQFYVQDYLVDLKTPGFPYQPNIKTFMVIFSMTSTKFYQHQYQVANVDTDNGLFVEDIEKQTSLLSYQERESSETSDGVTYIDYVLNLDARQINYKRTYDKVQNIVGNIGGLWQALYFACLIIIMPFIQSMLELNLINKFFTFSYKVDDVNQSASMNRSKSVLNSPPMMQKSSFISKQSKTHKSLKVLNISGVADIAKYLKEKKHDLEIGIGDICWFMMGKKKKEKQQFAYSVQKILKKLDIVYIMQKLFEIDKLKMVLLNDRQLKLFNYFPKPCIPESLFNKIDNEEQSQYLRQQEQQTQFAYILKEEETQEKKVEEAYKAYKSLKMRKGTDKDERILQHLDQDLINLFDYLFESEPRPDSISEEIAADDDQEADPHQVNFESEYKTYQKPKIVTQ